MKNIAIDRSEVLTHIGNEMLAKGVVHDTWPQALTETGCLLSGETTPQNGSVNLWLSRQ
ncbi:hypothetical protein O5290_31020, partial [Escherichia coli]|nr:hypothetical protein [Escherichia coli]